MKFTHLHYINVWNLTRQDFKLLDEICRATGVEYDESDEDYYSIGPMDTDEYFEFVDYARLHGLNI